MKDLYTLHASGSAPIAIVAKMVTTGSCSAHGCQYSSASISETLEMSGGPSGSRSAGTCTARGVRDTVTVPISVTPGVPFELEVTLEATSFFGSAYAGCSLSFDSLPPGGAITSCQGFTSAPPVATRGRSWGSLKLLYR